MTSIFSDEQRDSLMRAMTNPESNARKMMEQNQEIGMSPDITTEILNKYATYGANTGIGEIGGDNLVDALNEEYRKAVDAPLREMSEKASEGTRGGVQPQIPQIEVPSGSAAREIENAIKKAQELLAGSNFSTSPEGGVSVAQGLENAINSPYIFDDLGVAAEPVAADPTEVETPTEEGLTEGQEALTKIASTLGSILAQELINPLDEDPDPIIRAVKPKPFRTKQIRSQRIGMEDGGTVLNRKMFLGGGEVDGPGGPKEDLVPIWASDKEYVVSHKGVKRMGGGDFDKGIAALDRINFGK